MPSLFRRKRLMVVLIGFIVLVALIGFSMRDRDQLSAPERFVKDTVGWVQTIINKPVSFADQTIENVQDMFKVYEQNQILKARLSEYKGVIEKNQQLRTENEQLRQTIGKTEDLSDYSPVQATVIARSSERWFEQMTINKGSEHGIQKDMAVMTSDGLVGKIASVGAYHSTVQLLSGFDRNSKISALVLREGKDQAFGLIEGYDSETGLLLLEEIKLDEELEPGSTVVSSGLGGVFPSNLRIGTVEKVENDQYGLTKTAYVKPFADLYNIDHVIVVDRAMSTVDLPESQEEEGS